MKVVILAGGLGTRLGAETALIPKPMVEIGEQPLLWHIMKTYSAHGINDFIICCGYKGYIIKKYFANYVLHMSNVTFDMRFNKMYVHYGHTEPWQVTLIDTGEQTMTGGRLKRVREYIGNQTFCCTYGDAISNVNITQLVAFHKQQQTLATLTATQPQGRFGAIYLEKEQTLVHRFQEKPEGDGAWVNGGYFVLEPEVLDYIADDQTVWEQEPLQKLAQKGQLSTYKHTGFWQSVETLRDQLYLEELWKNGQAPWKI